MRSDDYIVYESSFETVEAPSFSDVSVPLAIFSTELSALQALVRYLHERRAYSFHQIAQLLNRSEKTIWATYQQAKHSSFRFSESSLVIPVKLFATRTLSPLETVVSYLASLGFSNVETARFLSLDPRTTWTVRRRVAKKEVVLA